MLESTNVQGINCSTPIAICTLQSNLTVQGDLVIGGDTDLAGKTIVIAGSLTQPGGTLNINNGTLDITGDYKIQSTSGGYSNGYLKMTNISDKVIVSGNFIMDSQYSHTNYLTAGVLEVKGNFTQKSSSTNINSPNNFNTSGTHKVILSGSNLQTVYFEDCPGSRFNMLESTNNIQGISCSTPMTICSLQSNLTVQGDLIINGDTDLAGKTVVITGSLTQPGGTLYINNGILDIAGDYKIQSTSGGYSNGYLKMTNASDRVIVSGNFIMDSQYRHDTYLTAGVLEVKGNFTQKSSSTNLNSPYNFRAMGTHKVILSGPNLQTISFEDYNSSRYYVLVITKPIDTGYSFNYQPVWVSLMNMGDDTEVPTTPTNLAVTSKTSTGVSLSWAHSVDNIVVSGYKILRDGYVIGETASNTYTDEGLLPATTYIYEVQAYDGNGNVSILSDAVTVTTETSNLDSDGDGIPDLTETAGIPIGFNGKYIATIYLDPNNKDTDGDGLDDGVELIKLKHYSYDSSADKWFYEAIDNPNSDTQGSFVCDEGIDLNFDILFDNLGTTLETYNSNILIANQYIDYFTEYVDFVEGYFEEYNDSEKEQVDDYIIKISSIIASLQNISDVYTVEILCYNGIDDTTIAWIETNTDYFKNRDDVYVAGFDNISPAVIQPLQWALFGTQVHSAVRERFKVFYFPNGEKSNKRIPNSNILVWLFPDLVYDDENIAEIYELKPITWAKQNSEGKYLKAKAQLENYITHYKVGYDRQNTSKGIRWPDPTNIIVPIPGFRNRVVWLRTFDDQPGLIYYQEVQKKKANEAYAPSRETVRDEEGNEYVLIAEDSEYGLALVAVGGVIVLATIAADVVTLGASIADDPVTIAAGLALIERGLAFAP